MKKTRLIFFSLDLISATNETNVNIPQMADTLFERAMNASWVVVFKALVTTHHMCIHGNEVSGSGTQDFSYRLRIRLVFCQVCPPSWLCFNPSRGLSSTWPPGTHCSTSAILSTKPVPMVSVRAYITAYSSTILDLTWPLIWVVLSFG